MEFDPDHAALVENLKALFDLVYSERAAK